MMSPEQRAAVVVAVSKQLNVVEEALDAARAALAVLSMESEEEMEGFDVPVKIGNPDPDLCQHPDDAIVEAGDERLCGTCGRNLTNP